MNATCRCFSVSDQCPPTCARKLAGQKPIEPPRPIRVNPRPSAGEPVIDAACTECDWKHDGERLLEYPAPGLAPGQRLDPNWGQDTIAWEIGEHVQTGHVVDVRRAKTERWIPS